MGLRFRKRVTLFPGVKINFGLKGTSLSIGENGATLNVGKKGTRATIGISGTGISYTEQLHGNSHGSILNKQKSRSNKEHNSFNLIIIYFILKLII